MFFNPCPQFVFTQHVYVPQQGPGAAMERCAQAERLLSHFQSRMRDVAEEGKTARARNALSPSFSHTSSYVHGDTSGVDQVMQKSI